MDAGDWTPEEWAALTRDDAPPAVRYEPWGEPLKKTHPEALQDADYVARKLLDYGSGFAGPLGWMLNAAVPRPAPGSATMQGVDTGLDYVGTFLGPLMGLLMSKQYARTKTGKPAPTWKEQEPYSRANSPREQLEQWHKEKPWENRPPEGESAWTYRNPPQIGGPTGRGMTKDEILAAIEKEKFQGMLKQIQESEAREALAQRVMPRAARPPEPEVPIDEARLEAVLERLRQGGLPSARELAERMRLPGLPGD